MAGKTLMQVFDEEERRNRTKPMQGQNVQKLIVRRMSSQAIPPGGGFAEGLAFLSDPRKITDAARKATEFVRLALQVIRESAEPNPWKHATDEEIAGKILADIEDRGKGIDREKGTVNG